MATFPQKQTVSTAITHRSNIPLSDKHQTTTNFMELGVAKLIEMVPDSGIQMDMRSFARLDSMKKPTQGDVNCNSRAYFVPFRVIQKGYNEIENHIPRIMPNEPIGIINDVDCLDMYNLVRAMMGGVVDTDDYSSFPNDYIETYVGRISYSPDNDQSDNYDFTTISKDTQDGWVLNGFNFTPKGARIYKLLTQLGYALDFNVAHNSQVIDTYLVSALPLRALLKIYLDHYFPSQYVFDESCYTVKAFIEYDGIGFENYATPEVLLDVFDFIDKVCYDNDYFVSAWDNPVSPNNLGYTLSPISIDDPTITGTSKVYGINTDNSFGTPVLGTIGTENSSPIQQISQFGLTALKNMTDYMKRHQISSRVIDRFLARWGIVLPDAKLDRSVYIDEFKQQLIFGDVTSTADTDGANLGSYAGKGILPEKNANFDFKTDERGYFIILSSCVPVVGYYQGMDRHCSHINIMDFYQPEFDNLGVQAIATKELYLPANSIRQYGGTLPHNDESEIGMDINNTVFGFIPRYAEYKVGNDKLTGDYRLGSRNTELEAWHLFRNVDHFFAGERIIGRKHDINFIRGFDSEQYNRIFNYVGDGSDHIKISHYFNYTLSFPGRKLYDSYEFTDEDKAQKVTVDVGGSKAN